MADSLQIRAGNKSGMPTLQDRELAYVRDEGALYIGANGNVKLCSADDPPRITALETTAGEHTVDISNLETTTGTHETQIESLQTTVNGKLTASPAAAQSYIASDAELSSVISAHNALVSALLDCGLMASQEE